MITFHKILFLYFNLLETSQLPGGFYEFFLKKIRRKVAKIRLWTSRDSNSRNALFCRLPMHLFTHLGLVCSRFPLCVTLPMS